MKKLFAILLTIVFVFNLVAVSVIGTAANESPTTDKICDYIAMYTEEELSALTADANDYYVSVFVMFNYPKLDTTELEELEKATRLSVIRNYYHTQNLIYAQELGIPTDAISSYTPYAEIAYESIAEYEQNKDFVYGLAESNTVSMIEISIMRAETYSSQSTSDVGNYDWDTLFSDVGITDHNYTGDGIKIGFVEKSIFQGAHYLPDGHLTQHGGYIDYYEMIHAKAVVSIAAGESGIAFDAYCYVSSLHGSTWRAALEWLINNNVDIINISVGPYAYNPNGNSIYAYNRLSAYIDYLINTTDTLVIAASRLGNQESYDIIAPEDLPEIRNEEDEEQGQEQEQEQEQQYWYSAPALSANALTVSAINVQKEMLCTVEADTLPPGHPLLEKPDLVAPGGNVYAYSYQNPVSGTSFSAGIVSGIAARLMEEFPILKNDAHLLKAVLTASCEQLPSQTEPQDINAGAGLINYNNARTIMQNRWYGTVIKEAETPDAGGAASFYLDTAPAGSTVTLRYVIPISGAYHASPSSLDLVHPSTYSTYNCIAFDLNQYGPTLSTMTVKNTGYVPLPANHTTTARRYCIDMYIGENRNEGVTEYIQFAYLIS